MSLFEACSGTEDACAGLLSESHHQNMKWGRNDKKCRRETAYIKELGVKVKKWSSKTLIVCQ